MTLISFTLAGSLILIIYSLLDLIKPAPFTKISFASVCKMIAEILFTVILPAIGIAYTNEKCGEHPFQNTGITTTYTLWAIIILAYFSARYLKAYLSPMFVTLISVILAAGLLFTLAVCIHFAPMVSIVVFPGLGMLYLSPFFSFFYLLREVRKLNRYLEEYLKVRSSAGGRIVNAFYHSILQNHLGFVTVMIAPFLLIVQAVLFLFGQQPDSIITQFTESCGFLLSKYQDCSCGGSHYLCSIAANGNKKLVRPVRYGVRANERIIVNRQLLVANAFESWLEDHTPTMHRMIRNCYDACNIPVNAWSKHKKCANVLYILMKPLEWLFLLWLYVFDKNPESRIARQYFPKQELDIYLKQNNYAKSN